MSKQCVITVYNELEWVLDAQMLEAVLRRCARDVPMAKIIDIYPQERKPLTRISDPGMLEWIIRVFYISGTTMTIGAIQHKPGDLIEFHT